MELPRASCRLPPAGYRFCSMRFSPVVLSLSLIGTAIAGCARWGARAPGQASFAITDITTIDVVAGRGVPGQTVLVSAGRITAVGSGVVVPKGARVIDGRGRYLVPGLWDMHVHTPFPEDLLPLYVAYGVTGVRDMGADLAELLAYRREVTAGDAVGPRIAMAGPILDGPINQRMPPEHRRWRIEIADTTRAGRIVDSIADLGADFVKIHQRLSPAVYSAIAREAARRGLAVAGHIPTAVGPDAAIAAGQRSVEHLINVPFRCTSEERTALQPRFGLEALFGSCATPDSVTALARRFARAGTWHTPTLVVQQRVASGGAATPGDPGDEELSPRVRDMMRQIMPGGGGTPPPDLRERLERLVSKRIAQVGDMHRAGVELLVGSDAPGVGPGWSVHEEMRLFTLGGLSPADALRAATLNPARWLGATDSLGSIAPGKRADLVLLDADPLADIRNTTRIVAVIADGRLYDRAALDAMRARARRGGR